MEEAEEMEAVKKAYAEILLNTAKEAAARVMAAEMKALRFQHDLQSTKDEALAMLLRLKQMLDSKTTEAEIKSLSQQRKIDELDAQLNEAEEIIVGLRLDSKQVQDKLEKEKKELLDELPKKQVPSFAENPTNEDKIKTPKLIILPSEDSGLETVTTSLKRTPLDQTIPEGNCVNAISLSDVEKYYAEDSGLASIVRRNKEPELYRNGCTQRIRALDRKLLDGNMHHSSDEENQNPSTKNGLISCAKIVGTEMSSGEVGRPVRARSARRRKNRFGKHKATSCNSFENSTKLPLSSSFYKSDFIQAVPKGKRNGTFKCRNTTLKSPLDQFSEPCGNVNSGQDQSKRTKNKLKMRSTTCLDPVLRSIKPEADLISGLLDVTVSTGTINDCEPAWSAAYNKGRKLLDELVLVKEEGNAAEILNVASLESKGELFDVPLVESDLSDLKTSEPSNRSPGQTGNNRVFKYTFTRKRKRDLSNPDQNTSPVKSCAKRRVIEKQTSLSEPQKSNLLNESTRDSGLLAQVADQLISLSDKRWW